MSHVAHHRLWRWRATAVALLLLGGCVIHVIATRAVNHVAEATAQATATFTAPIDIDAAQNRVATRESQDPRRIPDVLPAYAADHLDAHFVDFSHPEPLSPESIRAMALTQFLGLSSSEHELRAGRSGPVPRTIDVENASTAEESHGSRSYITSR